MIIKRLKNNSGVNKFIVTRSIGDQEYYFIPTNLWVQVLEDVDLLQDVSDGTIIVNDGDNDLSPVDGLNWLNQFETDESIPEELISDNRIKVNVTGSLGDGKTMVSGNDGTMGFLEDKIISADNKITIVVDNEGGDEKLEIELQPENVNTSELTNDAGFISSGEAPVQPIDIADFETSTQLDARDVSNKDRTNHTGTQTSSTISDFNTAAAAAAPVQQSDLNDFETSTQLDARDLDNRDRANHTGTQTVSTLSDFIPAVQSLESLTSLSVAGNILTYIDENGNATNVDLSVYIDDTNLARITSGTLDSVTGIITFTRDDLSTFTIDASSLLDNQDASEVPVTPSGNLTATNTQQALEDQQSELDSLRSDTDTNTGAITSLANITSIIDTGLQNQIDSNDIDISNIQSEQITQNSAIALNTPKVSADGSIDTHSDVDISTNPPALGDALAWDGSDFVPTAISLDNGYTIFPIWAEENGGLTGNNRQWSFGNGATGNINIVLPIAAELFAVSFDAETGTGTASINIYKNDANTFTTKLFSNKDFETLTTPILFSSGEYLGFRTAVDNGSLSDARVAAWFRIKTTALNGALVNDLLDVDTTGITAGQSIAFNGSNFVPIDVVDGNSLSTVATTGDYNDLSNLPALNSAAFASTTDFATAAQGALADTAVQPNEIANFEESSDLDIRDTNNRNRANHTGTQTASTISDFDSAASAAAPVQPSDLSDFETSTELDARDIANRDRSNHTGTQTASTISDFSSAVELSETTTNLTFNTTTKILEYINEAGVSSLIDLTQFLDDTNLSRLTTGTLDANTGIATFSRDDGSTFTVDFSDLNDQAAITQAITDHEASADPHPQYTTTAEASSAAPIQSVNGETGILTDYAKTNQDNNFSSSQTMAAGLDLNSNVINNVADPISDQQAATKKYVDDRTQPPFKAFVKTTTPAGNDGTTLLPYLTLNINLPEAGDYKLTWYYSWSINTTSSDFLAEILIDGSEQVMFQRQEAQDSAGNGIIVTNLQGGTFDSGTDQRMNEGESDIVTLSSGAHTIELSLANSIAGTEATMYRATLMIERWDV